MDLEAYAQRILLIDSQATATEIVDESIVCELITVVGSDCVLTQIGKELAKRQLQVDVAASPAAKECILKNVYLNPALHGRHPFVPM